MLSKGKIIYYSFIELFNSELIELTILSKIFTTNENTLEDKEFRPYKLVLITD